MGAIVNAVADTPLDTGIDPYELTRLSTFWEHTRELYSPFEASMKSPSSDVYLHEMPGGIPNISVCFASCLLSLVSLPDTRRNLLIDELFYCHNLHAVPAKLNGGKNGFCKRS